MRCGKRVWGIVMFLLTTGGERLRHELKGIRGKLYKCEPMSGAASSSNSCVWHFSVCYCGGASVCVTGVVVLCVSL